MTKIQAIIFDIGGVIFRAGDGPPLRDKWAARCGFDGETFDQIVFNSPHYAKAARGEISRETLWQYRNSQLKLPESDLQELIKEYWDGGFWDTEILYYIKRLAPHYKLGIISDATSGAREKVQKFIDLSLFDAVIFSYEAGVCKPDPKIYQMALDRLKIPAGAALFIDDRQKNVAGAQAIGMAAFLYEAFEPFKKFMSTSDRAIR